jgi:hypothetical protein
MKVKSLKYNYRQVGSTIDRDGAGEDYEKFTVGELGVVEIIENSTYYATFDYLILLENGTTYRVFNPNFVEYFGS